ncbi:Plant cysteine oxidase 2 [Hibiscus syriacus]|uniref:cysteine dioxygenase n=1 Tax=Hibiscus syriacus TaxID=106335 RepID=A0A6A3BWR9_HIBSY|nr:plant cysteine oxidase 2-like [Hibiscus syriacus]KAE8721176.1 Plant cysteine oxidase 2 [Hibiscus syriacus]
MMVDAGGCAEQGKNIMTAAKHVNNRVRYAKKTIKKNNRSSSCKKMRREVVFPRVPEVLQQLFVSCREIFKGPANVPPASDVGKLCNILDKMKAEDVGLSKSLHFFKARGAVKGTPRVTYTTIYQCDEFSLCIFFLPEMAVIPLHNHPGMTVFSKLLLGTMHIKSYDWVDPGDTNDTIPCSQLRLARLKANDVYTAPCDTSVLYPTSGGNIHEFTAITPCAVLDVIGPPYSKEDGRDCSYYKDFPRMDHADGERRGVSEEEGEGYGWLEEIEVPDGAEMDRIEYLGPQIIQSPLFSFINIL